MDQTFKKRLFFDGIRIGDVRRFDLLTGDDY
jgi:hypothetical protein